MEIQFLFSGPTVQNFLRLGWSAESKLVVVV